MAKTKKQNQRHRTSNWKALLFELIVVFLGVTAGFLLNNWQLARQDQILEQKYLKGFYQDVNANIGALQKAVKSDSVWIMQTKPKLMTIEAGAISSDSANTLIKSLIEISKLEIQKGTYENITNSGNLNIISDYQLKKQIVDYHVTISGTEFVDDYFYQYFNDYVMPFIFSNVNMIDAKLVDANVRKTTAFSNVVAGYYSMVGQRKTAYEELLQKSYDLRDDLSQRELE